MGVPAPCVASVLPPSSQRSRVSSELAVIILSVLFTAEPSGNELHLTFPFFVQLRVIRTLLFLF